MPYMDHAATSPLRPEALSAMLPYLTEHFGNPSGSHSLARRAVAALDEAREEIAQLLGCVPGEIVFTSGGTEAANLAVFGVQRAREGKILCSAIEHHAVLKATQRVGGSTFEVGADGIVDLVRFAEQLNEDVSLVSVMAVNNELGSIQPVNEVCSLAHEWGALVHCDAVAALPWLDLRGIGADLVSISAHKFGGPKGIGALVVRGKTKLVPVVVGGPQERERRAGTQNVAGIVAMAAALRACESERAEVNRRVSAQRDRLADLITSSLAGVIETTPRSKRVPGACHLLFEGVDQEELLLLLDDEGVAASAGAACASGALEPSHVLRAIGIPADRARGALRLSLGRTTADEDVDVTVNAVCKSVERLRA